ncbi:TraV family lipoprotein [Rugamonas sp. A1-17]|nr:TraV family lipoprotein [Rugamonas sp. A1-17]
MFARLAPSLAIAAALTGCVSMTGLTESSKFACKAPAGTTCTSVSGVYANSSLNNAPSRPASLQVDTSGMPAPAGATAFPVLAAGMPIRSQPRMLRIWMAPWRDEDDTLHDQAYMYVMVDPGKWLVERSRDATVQKTMTRLQPLGKPRTAAASSSQPDQAAGGQLASVRNNSEAQQSAREAAVVPGDAEEAK